MSNIKVLKQCKKCGIPGLFIECNADYEDYCPCCGHLCKDEYSHFDYYISDMTYCTQCNIFFAPGCHHSEDLINAAIMTGYTYQGVSYEGNLVFNNIESAIQFNNLVEQKKLQVTFECSCNGNSYNCIDRKSKSHKNKVITYGYNSDI